MALRANLDDAQALPAKLRLRLKISYTKEGTSPVTDQVDWSEPT